MLPKADLQQGMANFQDECFAIIGIIQREYRPLTLVEISEALQIPMTPHFVTTVRGLVVSGYLDYQVYVNEDDTYTICKRKGFDPYLPLPYYCLSQFGCDDTPNG